jgi:hypothetical protein
MLAKTRRRVVLAKAQRAQRVDAKKKSLAKAQRAQRVDAKKKNAREDTTKSGSRRDAKNAEV